MVIGRVIAGYRKANKLSLEKLEAESGIHRMTLWRLERGRIESCKQWPELIRWLFSK